MGKYVIEARPDPAVGWRPACEVMACSPFNPTRVAAEGELAVRREAARFRRLELRVACVEPDAKEAELLRAAKVPGADGRGPGVLRENREQHTATRKANAAAKAKAKK
jgi:hypothetical protein